MPADLRTHSRDLLDVATSCAEIAITIQYVGKGLARAWEFEIINGRHAKAVALRTLRRARQDLDELIAGLEGLPI